MPTQEDYQSNPYQYRLEDWVTSTPEGDVGAVSYQPRYLTDMLQRQGLVEQGQATPWERQLQHMQVQAAQQVPMRDPRTLQYNAGEQDATTLAGGSPDLARIMLGLRQRLQQGTATPQERALFDTTLRGMAEQTYRSVVPQASDAFNPLGDQFFGALGTLALGATGGLAAAPLAAGGAGLTTTLGSLGTLAGVGGTAAGALGSEMDQEWLRNVGLALGAAGGLAGGAAGLARLAGTGVTSLGDAARLAQSAGRITGTAGRLSGNDALQQAGGYVGMAGGLGSGVDNLSNLLSGTGGSLQGVLGLVKPLAGLAGRFLQPGQPGQPGQQMPQRPVTVAPQRPLYSEPATASVMPAPGAGAGGIQALLQAARQAQQRGMQGPVQPSMTNQDWLRWNWQGPQPTAQSILGNL